MKLQCEYSLIAEEDQIIEVVFEHFEVDKNDDNCQADFVKIRDGLNDDDPWFTVKGKVYLCSGIKNGTKIYSTSNIMKIFFNTDSTGFAKGWNLTYRSVDHGPIRSVYDSKRLRRYSENDITEVNRSDTDVKFHSPDADYERRDKYDWYGAYIESEMPDFSDFRHLLNLDAEEIIGNGHQAKDFIIQCVFDRMLCSYRHFKTTQTKEYGNCFSFNSIDNLAVEKPYNTTKFGATSGLKISLFLDLDEYLGLTGQSSFPLLLHQKF